MTKIDLITGFLGSGKTTFIKKYARHLMDRGENICILENDYGAVNVDMMLMQELYGENCELEMVAGGCDHDCHKRRFKTKLISMGMCGYDRVIVEPSGIFDVDEFFDALREEPLDRWYRIDNVIGIVDAAPDPSLSDHADLILGSQLAQAGRILLSRTQEASSEEIEETIAHIERTFLQVHCDRAARAIIVDKPWDQLTEKDLEDLSVSGYYSDSHLRFHIEDEDVYGSRYFMNLNMTMHNILNNVNKTFASADCGNVFRVKGFFRDERGQWLELNATRRKIECKPIAEGQEILILIGEHLKKEEIDMIWGASSL